MVVVARTGRAVGHLLSWLVQLGRTRSAVPVVHATPFALKGFLELASTRFACLRCLHLTTNQSHNSP